MNKKRDRIQTWIASSLATTSALLCGYYAQSKADSVLKDEEKTIELLVFSTILAGVGAAGIVYHATQLAFIGGNKIYDKLKEPNYTKTMFDRRPSLFGKDQGYGTYQSSPKVELPIDRSAYDTMTEIKI